MHTPELIQYGIHTENSDIRAHVSPVNWAVYIFQTFAGVDAIQAHNPPLRTATQPGVTGATAEGWLVKLEWIDDLRRRQYYSWPHWAEFQPSLSTSRKGELAVKCVVDLMKIGRFPLWIDAGETDAENIQIAGTDIVLFCRKKIQVKCDYRSGHKPNGTGNFFLQKAERNPHRLH